MIEAASAQPLRKSNTRRLSLWTVLVVFLVVFAGILLWRRVAERRIADTATTPVLSAQRADDALHVLIGADRTPYTDQSGQLWTADKYCTGGTPFKVAEQNFFGTEEPTLFLAGIRGNFHCKFPVHSGIYELHLLFAEAGDVRDISRIVIYSINGGPSTNLDIVDDAAGSNTATTKVIAGVSPTNDGTIHLDFMNEDSLLNAVEILPAASDRPLPVRIVAGPAAVRDQQGQIWLSDRDFFGGRSGRYPPLKSPALALFGFERVGHFRYVIPVDPKFDYSVKLHFIEHWFGKDNGGAGGVGSRIFNVSCNGSTLLKNYDILADGGYNPITKIFKGIEPTAQGKIELDFTPVVNFSLINAIEITPEAVVPNRKYLPFDSSR